MDTKFEVGDNSNDNHNHKGPIDLNFPLHVRHYPKCLVGINAHSHTVE